MDITKLNPWNWFKKEEDQGNIAVKNNKSNIEQSTVSPLVNLHSEMDRLFNEAFKNFGINNSPIFSGVGNQFKNGLLKPDVDISGSEKEYNITAELPGIDEKDINIELKGDTLVITGEKKNKEESNDNGYYRVERSYGYFQRVLNIPKDADVDNIKAGYKNGVLSIALPRLQSSGQETRKIAIS